MGSRFSYIVETPGKYKNYSENKVKDLPTLESKDYFARIKRFYRENYDFNYSNPDNIATSFEKKSFINLNTGNSVPRTQYIYWVDYLTKYLNKLSRRRLPWASKLCNELHNYYFYKENFFQSILFFQEFSLTTKPQCLCEVDDIDKENQELIFTKIKNFKNDKDDLLELRMTRNLGGSFHEMNVDDLLPDDPNAIFAKQRKICKDIVKVMKDLLKFENHPIAIVIDIFAKEFSSYVNNEVEKLTRHKEIDDNIDEDLIKRIKDRGDDITKQLQKFIIKLQVCIKLFYCQVIDYSCFGQEKDELINMITSILFQNQRIYDCMYDLYELTTFEAKQNLEIKFNDLKNCTPQKLGISDKFSLNEETLKLKKSMIEKKKNENKQKEQKENAVINIDNNENLKIENAGQPSNQNTNLESLQQIKESEEDDVEDEDEVEDKINLIEPEPLSSTNINNEINTNITSSSNNNDDNIMNERSREQPLDDSNISLGSKNIHQIKQKKSDPDIFHLSNLHINDQKENININNDDDDIKNNPLYSDAFQVNLYTTFQSNARNTVTAFNNKQLNFPKLHTNIRDTISRKKDYIELELKKNKTPPPYISAIEILELIKKFRSPFEKMLVIASISDEITECVNSFWGNIQDYAKRTFLEIEINELMTIVLYIIIKTQMPELVVYIEMIKNFTTPTIKGTTIGMYYATLEASIALIEDLEDTKNENKTDEQLANARVTLANINSAKLGEIAK